MELTKLTENLNNIQSLPDKPTLTAEELKQEFDKGPNAIKDYINDILTVELFKILQQLETNVSSGASLTASINNIVTTMKKKLDGIEDGANKYTHPTSAGNKHIPSGGSSGKILGWASDGTAKWVDDKNTTYSNVTTSKSGLMTATDKIKLDGIANGANKYTHPTTAGNKHIPSGGSSGKILGWASDGTAKWVDDKNTTYGNATTTKPGLMSAADKVKLDGAVVGEIISMKQDVAIDNPHIQTITVSYPEGYNINNSYVLGIKIRQNNTGNYENIEDISGFNSYIGKNGISISIDGTITGYKMILLDIKIGIVKF